MTTTTVQAAPPFPTWCEQHIDGGEGTYFHSMTVATLQDLKGLYGDEPITVEVQLEQYDGPGVTDREPHVYLSSSELTMTGSLNLSSPEQVSLLGEALNDAAMKLGQIV